MKQGLLSALTSFEVVATRYPQFGGNLVEDLHVEGSNMRIDMSKLEPALKYAVDLGFELGHDLRLAGVSREVTRVIREKSVTRAEAWSRSQWAPPQEVPLACKCQVNSASSNAGPVAMIDA